MFKKTLLTVIKSLGLFLLIFFVADRSLAYYLDSVYNKQTRGDFFQTTYAVKNVKDEILIFGSSRAMHHYVSAILENELHRSTYNIGRNGKNILYSNALFDQILTYHHPEMVVLDVSPFEFSWKAGEEGEDEMIFSLLPYLDQPSIKHSIQNVRKKDIFLSRVFKTYPYNSTVAQLLGYRYGFMSGIRNEKGYVALNGSKVKTMQETNDSEENEIASPDSTLISAFVHFLTLAQQKQIQVYVVVSPTTRKHVKSSIPTIHQLTKKFGFNFADFSQAPEFNNPALFYDNSHLNDIGAKMFTKLIAEKIKVDQKNTASNQPYSSMKNNCPKTLN